MVSGVWSQGSSWEGHTQVIDICLQLLGTETFIQLAGLAHGLQLLRAIADARVAYQALRNHISVTCTCLLPVINHVT